jgi:Na+/H+ antiporter NhaA
MSLFITNLAFGAGDEGDIARISVLLASGIAMLAGFIWLAGFGSSKR